MRHIYLPQKEKRLTCKFTLQVVESDEKRALGGGGSGWKADNLVL
jgi:hypothetical protein